MITESEIKTLLTNCLNIRYGHIDPITGHREDAAIHGIEDAARTIASRLTPAHLMSHFVTSIGYVGHESFSVPDNGQFYTVRFNSRSPDCDGFVLHPVFCGGSAWRDDCKSGKCIHIEAVKLHLTRGES